MNRKILWKKIDEVKEILIENNSALLNTGVLDTPLPSNNLQMMNMYPHINFTDYDRYMPNVYLREASLRSDVCEEFYALLDEVYDKSSTGLRNAICEESITVTVPRELVLSNYIVSRFRSNKFSLETIELILRDRVVGSTRAMETIISENLKEGKNVSNLEQIVVNCYRDTSDNGDWQWDFNYIKAFIPYGKEKHISLVMEQYQDVHEYLQEYIEVSYHTSRERFIEIVNYMLRHGVTPDMLVFFYTQYNDSINDDIMCVLMEKLDGGEIDYFNRENDELDEWLDMMRDNQV